jgi:ubiquinone biosynthesis protein COQ9
MNERKALTDRDKLLASALDHVPFVGWTDGALWAAANDQSIDKATARRLFPSGGHGLLTLFLRQWNQRMIEALAAIDLESMRIRERIATAVRVRLEQNSHNREAIRLGLAHFALPQHAAEGTRWLYDTVDAMWRAAGDTSTDYNFYTKRLLLAGVYASTLVYWLDDRSENSADTWAFLDRRIENVMGIQKFRGRLEGMMPNFDRLARFLRPRRSAS